MTAIEGLKFVKYPEHTVLDDGAPCAFCNARKPNNQTIGGPGGIRICRDCVSLCNDILTDRDNEAKQKSISALVAIEQAMPDGYQPHELIAAIYQAIEGGKVSGLEVVS
ncbi:ClpX C4-type zinc finger protein [Serratia marcescens]|uniref:ClpX C4-type zinc finger protein n=1 Tax=Serratia marcescens TaxID=615 RepID=UPI00066A6D64|nr:ClpX C4-type zinc finger protein [Serratia marcescens]